MWVHPDGSPLKFQSGDYVMINTDQYPDRAYSLPFLCGYVRGYSISGPEQGVGYELYKMGSPPLAYVKEEFLTKAAEHVPHKHTRPVCGICGKEE